MNGQQTARVLVIDLVRIGSEWAATSAQLPAFREFGDDRESVKAAARERLGPAVRIEFRDVPASSFETAYRADSIYRSYIPSQAILSRNMRNAFLAAASYHLQPQPGSTVINL